VSRRSPNTARDLAELRCRVARESLNKLGQWIFPKVDVHRDSTEMYWETSFRSAVKICGRRGDWTLHGMWRYWDDPSSGTGVLRESSMGVTVAGAPFDGQPDTFCVARYDVECYGSWRGRHINVFQPVIGDSVHWVVCDERRFEDWPLEETLQFLVEELCPELTQAGWPAS
jgi:hypothetical protein